MEFDGADGIDLTHRYLWGIGADYLLSDEQVSSTLSDGTVYWALSDQVGTIRDIGKWDSSNSEYTVVNHREYDTFGNLIAETAPAVALAYSFTGKRVDPETGYTHHQNRWFDPVIGKWISEDPIGFAAGDTNVSRYVTNRATSKVDTDGLTEGESSGGGAGPAGVGSKGGDDGIGHGIVTTGGQGELIADPGGNLTELFATTALKILEAKKLRDKYEKELMGSMVEVHPLKDDHSYWGTPVKPYGSGAHVNIFGSGENPKFDDYTTHEMFAAADTKGVTKTRIHTKTLPDNVASHVIVRTSPIKPYALAEILRIMGVNSKLTFSHDKKNVLEFKEMVYKSSSFRFHTHIRPIEGSEGMGFTITFSFLDEPVYEGPTREELGDEKWFDH